MWLILLKLFKDYNFNMHFLVIRSMIICKSSIEHKCKLKSQSVVVLRVFMLTVRSADLQRVTV